MWLSDEFGLMVEDWVEEWRNGRQPQQESEEPMMESEILYHAAKRLFELRKGQKQLFKRTDRLSYKVESVNSKVDALDRRVTEKTQEMDRQYKLATEIMGSDAPPERKDRELVKFGLLRYAESTGEPIANCYHIAYVELKLRTGFDVFSISTKRGTSKLDEVEKAKKMADLKSIVNWMLNSLSKSTYGEVTIEDILYSFF